MSWLDRLRSRYVKAPPRVRRAVGRLLSLVPVDLRFGATYRQTRDDLRRGDADPDYVERRQAEMLDALLASCAARSRHYQRVFAEAGIARPRAADLARLPILTREEVRGHEEEFLAAPRSELEVVTTSGSSGQPLTLYLDRDRSVREWAFLNHIWSWIGYHPGDVRATVRYAFCPGPGEPMWEYDSGLHELRLSPYHMSPEVVDEYLLQIERHRVQFLHGYPSALIMLAIHALRVGWRPPACLRGILPISEVMYESQRRLVAEAFGPLPIQPVYGMSEKVAIAGERGGLFTYDFEPLYGVAEIVDAAGRPVAVGERGRLVATGFICPGMPLVRYDTGDQATLVARPGRENGWRLRVANPSSKWVAEYLVSRAGAPIGLTSLIFPRSTYDLIQAYQYYQDTPGVAVMRVVPLAGVTPGRLQPIVDELHERTSGMLELRVELVASLPDTRGKRKYVDQRVPLDPELRRVLAD